MQENPDIDVGEQRCKPVCPSESDQHLRYSLPAKYTRPKKKRTTAIFPLRSPFNKKMLIVMKYSFLIKSY